MVAMILGGNKLNTGIAQRLSHLYGEVVVLDWHHNQTGVGEFVRYDVTSSELPNYVQNSLNISPESIWTSIDLAVPNLNKILKNQGKQFYPRGLFDLTKLQMLEAWRGAGLLSRKYWVNPITESFDDTELDVVVKPNQGSGSRGVSTTTISNSAQFIAEARRLSLDGNALVEERVFGTEFTVELAADRFGNTGILGWSQKHHSRYAKFDTVSTALYYGWSSFPEAVISKLCEKALGAFEAFQPKSTLGHLEIIYSDKENAFHPIEIGFRSSGFIASDLLNESFGNDCIEIMENIYRGQRLGKLNSTPKKVATYYFPDLLPGTSLSQIPKFSEKYPKYKSIYYATLSENSATANLVQGDGDRHSVEILTCDLGGFNAGDFEAFEDSMLKRGNHV